MALYDRDFVHVKGQAVRHTTAQRDWRCGLCGSHLALKFYLEAPNWRTVCQGDEAHHPDEFVHKDALDWQEHRNLEQDAKAQEVWAHLPEEYQRLLKPTTL
jgi:hypothetical protein